MPPRRPNLIRRRSAAPLTALALLLAPCAALAAAVTSPSAPPPSAGGVVAPTTTVGATRTTVGPAGVTSTTTVTATVPTPTVSVPATTPAPAAQGTGVTPGSKTPAAPASKSSGKISDAALLAAIVAGLIALACLIWAIFRFGAFEPHWLLSLRHSLAEGGFRASATWAEFTDWIRLGR